MRARILATITLFLVITFSTAHADTTAFIKQAYQDLLDRSPSSFETTNGLTYLGSNSRTSFALVLDTSAEYRGILINGFYEELLGRAVDPTGLAVYQAFMGGGGTDEQVIGSISNSAEFFTHVGGTDADLITALYGDLLHRSPTSSDVLLWTAYLASHNPSDMVAILAASDDYRTILIDGWYNEFLRRSVDPAGLAFFLGQMGSGATDEQVIAEIIGSQEYFDFAARNQATTPEPASAWLLALGAMGLWSMARRRLL